METNYYNTKTGKVNYKAIEKALGYKLTEEEREYCIYFYQSGNSGLPDFNSEEAMDFIQMVQMQGYPL